MLEGEDLPVTTIRKWSVAFVEGVRFLWSFKKARPAYIHWRLGTVYGSFDKDTGKPRPIKELLAHLWRDREHVIDFLVWRRSMRR
jgi:hypothetical protein